MKVLVRLAAVAAIGAMLGGCTNEPQQYSDVHTGVSAGASKKYQVYENLLVSVWGQAFVAKKGSETKYGIYINQIATGVGWSFFDSAYSFGVKLPYVRGENNVMGCSGSCTLQETGLVVLTADQFSKAASSGMQLELVGAGRNVVIDVPAEAFQEALTIRPS